MFLEATVVVEEKDGEEQRFLQAKNAVGTGSLSKRARLTGRMHEGIEKAGGLLISSSGVVSRLRETGLSIVSIDSDKGDDLPEDVKPLTDPSRRPPPEGRLVHFDEEIERATEIRNETATALKSALADVVAGRGVDVQKVNEARQTTPRRSGLLCQSPRCPGTGTRGPAHHSPALHRCRTPRARSHAWCR